MLLWKTFAVSHVHLYLRIDEGLNVFLGVDVWPLTFQTLNLHWPELISTACVSSFGLFCFPPPAGQLCAAATSLRAARAKVGAQSSDIGAPRAAVTTDTPFTSRAELVSELPLLSPSLWLTATSRLRPSPSAEAHCLRRSATVRCPITSRALRRHRHTAPGFGNSIEDSRGTEEPEGISTGRRLSLLVLTKWGSITSRWFLFSFDLSLYITLLTGQDTQRLPLLDERELCTSLGKTQQNLCHISERTPL